MLPYTGAGRSSEVVRLDSPRWGSVLEDHGTRHIILVADRFAHFADGKQVLTISGLVSLASSGVEAESDCEWVLHVGQGIEQSDWEILESTGVVGGNFRVRVADSAPLPGRPLAPATVHKHRAENVLLANLRNLSKLRCLADLRIHKNNELILDHTAKHVPGMVVIEAMRQICIAQFETGYRPELTQWEYAGVWRRMNVSFEDFLFAVPAVVVSEIIEANLEAETNLRFRAATSVWQNDGVVASAEIEYSMIKQERLDALERRKAARTARAQLAGLGEQ